MYSSLKTATRLSRPFRRARGVTDISKAAGAKRKALSEKEQKPYQEKYQKKNEEYKAAMEEYKKLHGKDAPVEDDEENAEPAKKKLKGKKTS